MAERALPTVAEPLEALIRPAPALDMAGTGIVAPARLPERSGAVIEVAARPHPFREAVVTEVRPAGTTLRQIVADLIREPWLRSWAAVSVDGELVHPMYYVRPQGPEYRPKPGRRVTVTVVPQGEGEGKNTAAVILSAVVLIAAAAVTANPQLVAAIGGFVGGGAATGAAIVAAGALGATIAINALLPPPQPKLRDQAGAPRVSPSIVAARNELRPFGVVPRVLGRVPFFPPLGARQFTEVVGNDQYLRVLIDWGRGPLRLSELKIGDTPLSSFQDVEAEVRNAEVDDPKIVTNLTDDPLTLFTNVVDEQAFQINLAEGLPEGEGQIGPWYVRRSGLDADELSVDITYLQGVGKMDKGQRQTRTTKYRIRYAPAGTENWTEVGLFEVTDNLSVQPLRRGNHWKVARGQYDVAVRQEGLVGHAENPQEALVAEAIWTALRTITAVDPITAPGHTKLALRIRATNQLSAILDSINGVAESILPDWDSGTQTWITRPTNNPASLARHVLQGAEQEEPVPDGQLDLAQLQHFHEWCASKGFAYNAVIDYETTDLEVLDDILAAGRAARTIRDGNVVSLIIDEPQATPRAMFSPRNSWGLTLEKSFVEIPHALRGLFPIGPAQVAERLIFDDGFTEQNATKYADFESPGVTDADQLYRLGRYRLAELHLRPERATFFTDLEHLVVTRGDRVRLQYDTILVGLGAGRIRELVTSGSDTTGVVLDEEVSMESGKSYTLVVRLRDNTEQIHTIVTQPGLTTTLTFQSPIATGAGPQVDDLALFGESGVETMNVLIRSIRPMEDGTAQLSVVPYDDAIYTADTEAIPEFDPKITRPPDLTAPPAPVVDTVQSDEFVLSVAADGSLEPRIVVGFHYRSGSALPVAFVEGRFREATTNAEWRPLPPVTGDLAHLVVQPVEEGRTYEIRLRSVAGNGAVSPWVEVPPHTVVGTRTPPPDVPAVFVQDRELTWTYPTTLRDLAGFRVRRHLGNRRTWSDAEPLHGGLISGTSLPGELRPMGLVTYLVKAVDLGDRESVNPGIAMVDLGAIPVENVVLTKDFKAEGFPGTIVNGTILNGELVALDVGGLMWSGDDARPFWTGQDLAAFWKVTKYAELTYIFSLLPAADQVPADLTLNPDVTAEAIRLDYRISGSELFWTSDAAPFWSGNDEALFWSQAPSSEEAWMLWPGELEKIERLVHEFRLRLSPGPIRGTVHGLQAVLDVPDLLESFADLTCPVEGIRLPIQAPYRQITRVEASVKDDGVAVGYVVVDKDPVQGPLLKIVDASRAFIAGVFASVHIVGY